MAALLGRTTLRQHQAGGATLLMTMGLLLGMSLTLLYLNRSLVFEQRASANQVRATLALELAEAGLEWATGMLNTAHHIDANCSFAGGSTVSFRRQYVQTDWGKSSATATDMSIATSSYPGCKIDGNNWACNCPDISGIGAVATNPGSTPLPGFSIVFSATSDPEAVRVLATGCTALVGACTPASGGTSDASATVSAILKLRRMPRALPGAALTCGSSCTVGASYNISNQDVASGGLLVNAGSAIKLANGASATSIPGQAGASALLGNDSSLSALSSNDPDCSKSAVFGAFFGSTVSQYAHSPLSKSLADCGSASTCSALVDAAYAEGWRSFYFPDGFARNGSGVNLGSAEDPVTLVSGAAFNLDGNLTIYGIIFSNDANATDTAIGSARIRGALLTCASYDDNASGALAYDGAVLQALQRSTGPLVRVPGSWTDRCRASKDQPPVISCS